MKIHPFTYWRLRARMERIEDLAERWSQAKAWDGQPATVDRAFGGLLKEALGAQDEGNGMQTVSMLWEDAPQDMRELQELEDLQKKWRERRLQNGEK